VVASPLRWLKPTEQRGTKACPEGSTTTERNVVVVEATGTFLEVVNRVGFIDNR
jgi:hypothetical protein